jgi:hypothetical protein
MSWASGFLDRQYSDAFPYNLAHYSSTWSKVILEKLVAAQLVNKLFPFMYAEGLLPCLQGPATGPCNE